MWFVELVALLAINGLVWGLIIALIALGLSIIFGLLDIINLAHGDFFMVGTVLTWFVFSSTGNYWLAFLIVPLIGLVLGALVERTVIQPIRGTAALSIVATFGLSIIIQETVRATYGAAPKRILPPIEGTIPLFGIEYDIYRVFAAFVSIAAIAGFFLFLHRTKLGTWMRAVRVDRETALAMGVPATNVYVLTFAIGFAMASFGGKPAAFKSLRAYRDFRRGNACGFYAILQIPLSQPADDARRQDYQCSQHHQHNYYPTSHNRPPLILIEPRMLA